MYKGYELGISFLNKVEESGIMDKIFKGAGILGLMVIGGMVATNVSVPLTVAYDDVKILDTINGVMPNLLPLCFTGLIFYFLKKDIKVTIFWLVSSCLVSLVPPFRCFRRLYENRIDK